MSISSKILENLKLQKGDGKLLLLPLLYSFFSGASLAFFVTATTSLFLNSFDRHYLSIVFIVSGVLVLITGKVYSAFQKKYSFSKALKGGLAVFLLSIITFLLLFISTHSIIVIFILYAWIRVFAYIHAISFWMFVGRLFSIQQGKKVFGLISNGEVFASILSFFSVPLILNFFLTEDLLLISGITLLIAFIILRISLSVFKNRINDESPKKNEKTKVEKSKKSLSYTKYYKLFFVIAFIPIFAQFFVDFIFQAQAQHQFIEKEELTAFIGIFFGLSSIIEFVFKGFVSGTLISKYGIKAGLYSFPVVLGITMFGASVFGLIFGGVLIFFSFVALGRLFTRAVRTSFYDPAVQILYQPLPPDERMVFQNKIESGPKAYAGIAAGIMLLLFAKFESITLVYFSIFIFVVILFWFKYVSGVYTEYKNVLRNTLAADDKEENINQREILFNIISERYSEVKQSSQRIIKNYTKFLIPFLRNKIFTEDIKADNFKFSQIVKYSLSKNADKRIIAAKVLGKYKIYKAERHLIRLLNDKDYNVRCEAIITAGKMKDSELFDNLMSNIRIKKYRNITSEAILNIGENILPYLELLFNKTEFDNELQIQIINIFKEIKCDYSINFLKKNISHSNSETAYLSISALGSLSCFVDNKDISIVNIKLNDEIKNFIYIISSINDIEPYSVNDVMLNHLNNEKQNKKNRIFSLLTGVYDQIAISLIKNNLDENDETSRGFALEIADFLLSDLHKNMLLPLFESNSDDEIIRKYSDSYIIENLSLKDRLIDILNANITICNSTIKIEAVKLLNMFDDEAVLKILKANIVHPDIIIAENAAISLYNLYSDYFDDVAKNYANVSKGINNVINKIRGESFVGMFLVSEKHKLLDELPLFVNFIEDELIELAKNTKEVFLEYNDIVDFRIKDFTSYIFISGKMIETASEKTILPGNIINFFNDKDSKVNEFNVEEDSLLLQTDFYIIQNIILNKPEFFEKYIENIYNA